MTPVLSDVVIGVAILVAGVGAVQLLVWLGEILIHRWRYYVACKQIARELFPPTNDQTVLRHGAPQPQVRDSHP